MPVRIEPQQGPQTDFLSSIADVVIYGGAAGGGKSFALLLEPLRHYNNRKFSGVIFRRNATQIRNPGGLWDEANALYLQLGAQLFETSMEAVFPSGMSLKFAHLEYEKNVYDWQGSQVAFIGFDELTHFTEKQFFYMLSRNRSMSGVPGYVRATCNPDADSWVKKLISWYIDQNTGKVIKERAGVIRYFVRIEDDLVWGDTREELEEKYGKESFPKSFTFIPASIYDNQILMQNDPSYMANLNALSRVDRLRLKEGDWNVRPSAGMFFQRGWFEVIDTLPAGGTCIRYWDRAATKPHAENKDPDFTAGVKLWKYPNKTFVIEHVARVQDTPLKVETLVKNTATADGRNVKIGIEQDPGSAGVADVANFAKLLQGWNVRSYKPTEDKQTRAKAASAQVEAGNVKVLRGPWNDAFFTEVENFPDPATHDDQVDAFSGAFNALLDVATDDWLPWGAGGTNKFA